MARDQHFYLDEKKQKIELTDLGRHLIRYAQPPPSPRQTALPHYGLVKHRLEVAYVPQADGTPATLVLGAAQDGQFRYAASHATVSRTTPSCWSACSP